MKCKVALAFAAFVAFKNKDQDWSRSSVGGVFDWHAWSPGFNLPHHGSQAWSLTPIIPALGRVEAEHNP